MPAELRENLGEILTVARPSPGRHAVDAAQVCVLRGRGRCFLHRNRKWAQRIPCWSWEGEAFLGLLSDVEKNVLTETLQTTQWTSPPIRCNLENIKHLHFILQCKRLGWVWWMQGPWVSRVAMSLLSHGASEVTCYLSSRSKHFESERNTIVNKARARAKKKRTVSSPTKGHCHVTIT